MVFEDFFINDTYEVNWEFVLKLPHFKNMKKTEQNPRWHMEGNVMEHVKLTTQNMIGFVGEHFSGYSLERKRLLILSAVFHDVGKPNTTFKGGKDNNYHSYGHENVGEKIAREMLFDWPLYQREYICNMVKYHMEPLFFKKHKNPELAVKKIVSILPYKDLYYLKMSDLLGAIQDPKHSTKEQDLKILEDFYKIAEEYTENNDNATSPFVLSELSGGEFESSFSCIDSDLQDFKASFKGTNKPKGPKIYVFIGLPGSGKNTYIEKTKKFKDCVILSRDDIRVELGYCKPNEKVVCNNKQENKVSSVFDSRMETALEKRQDVVINNINLSVKRRKELKARWGKYNPVWEFIYIEAPTLAETFRRRRGQISEKVYYEMLSRFDFPDIFECDYLTIVKQ